MITMSNTLVGEEAVIRWSVNNHVIFFPTAFQRSQNNENARPSEYR